jgi:hypothetical protein
MERRLLNDYGIKLHDLLMLQLQFTNRINLINLKRMIIGIENEEALYNKTSNMVRQETELMTKKLKNAAHLIRQEAELKGNNTILKIEQINFTQKLEMTNLGITKLIIFFIKIFLNKLTFLRWIEYKFKWLKFF